MIDVVEVNAETGDRVERDFTAEEIAQLEIDKARFVAIEAEQTAKETAKQSVLQKLGLTAEELAALL